MKYLYPVNVLAVSILLAGMSAAQITDPSNAQANTDSSVQAANKLSRFDLGKLDITGLKFLGMKVTQVNHNQPGSQVNNPDSPNTGSTTNVMLGPVQFSSAPALSAVIIAAVCSADLGTPPPGEILCETISSGQVATTDPQGGSFEYVVEEELGYGDNPVATMNGSVLPSSLLIETQNICEDFSGNLTFSCQAGETVVGFAHWYNTTSFQSGRFTYQNTSTNSPFNTLSTFIEIN